MALRIPVIYSKNGNIQEIIKGINGCIENSSNILIVGNGFDLALGKSSKYQDFLLYLFIICLYQNIQIDEDKKSAFWKDLKQMPNKQEYDKHIDDVIDIAEKRIKSNGNFDWLKKTSKDYSFLELLLKVIFQNANLKNKARIKARSNNITVFDYWFPEYVVKKYYNLECIYYIVEKFCDTSSTAIKEKICVFWKELIEEIDKNHLHGWLDIESFIDCLVLKNKILMNRFVVSKHLLDDLCTPLPFDGLYLDLKVSNQIYQSLDKFTNEFCEFISLQNDNQTDSSCYSRAFDEETSKYECLIRNQKLSLSKYYDHNFNQIITSIIDFNYSNTSEITFLSSYKSKDDFSIYQVNGKCQDKSAVFGYTNSNQIQVNSEAFKFEKRTQRLLKNVPSVDFDQLTQSYFNMFIFGHSCSLADKDIFEPLLKSDHLQFVIVFCFSELDRISIYKNLCEMVGYQYMDHLLRQTDSPNQRLIWALYRDNKQS